MVLNEADIAKPTVNVTVDVTTMDTGVAPRDGDLKSANLFDVAQFPTATFVSTSIAKNGNGLTVSGNLTLHGVTKPVVLQLERPTGPVPGIDKKHHSGFSGTNTISRTVFGIATRFPTAVVGDEVKLTIDLDIAKQWKQCERRLSSLCRKPSDSTSLVVPKFFVLKICPSAGPALVKFSSRSKQWALTGPKACTITASTWKR